MFASCVIYPDHFRQTAPVVYWHVYEYMSDHGRIWSELFTTGSHKDDDESHNNQRASLLIDYKNNTTMKSDKLVCQSLCYQSTLLVLSKFKYYVSKLYSD